jgi:hypothetical protein
MTPPRVDEKVIQEGEKINLKESDFKDKSIVEVPAKQSLTVTPLTPFAEVFNYLAVLDNDFHENPETNSRFYAYS